jgi:hypothetical protein
MVKVVGDLFRDHQKTKKSKEKKRNEKKRKGKAGGKNCEITNDAIHMESTPQTMVRNLSTS